MKVYICAPYRGNSIEERRENRRRAQIFGRHIALEGHEPFVPHLAICEILDEDDPSERTLGIEIDKTFIDQCDLLIVFGEPTSGMQHEIEYAKRKGIHIKTIDEKEVKQIMENMEKQGPIPATENNIPIYSFNDVVEALNNMAYTNEEDFEHMLKFASELTGKSIDALSQFCNKEDECEDE